MTRGSPKRLQECVSHMYNSSSVSLAYSHWRSQGRGGSMAPPCVRPSAPFLLPLPAPPRPSPPLWLLSAPFSVRTLIQILSLTFSQLAAGASSSSSPSSKSLWISFYFLFVLLLTALLFVRMSKPTHMAALQAAVIPDI